MPGFDRNRFVSITEEEVEDLTCSICHEIIKDPMTTNCCLQAYCGNCITEWLTNKTTCPYDRTPLTQTDLRPVPRYKSLCKVVILILIELGCLKICWEDFRLRAIMKERVAEK